MSIFASVEGINEQARMHRDKPGYVEKVDDNIYFRSFQSRKQSF
jgi:hypothetical protein